MVKEPELDFVVELDDEDLDVSEGTPTPCGALIIATFTQCFNGTLAWGSCRLGTRACC